MNVYLVFQFQLFLIKNTHLDCSFNSLDSNESLIIPFIEVEKTIELPKKVEFSINQLNLISLKNNLQGGAINFFQPVLEFNINNTHFKNNFASLSGGAIHYEALYSFNIDNCTFENHSSGTIGGSVFAISQEGDITIQNSDFKDSTSILDGGVGYFYSKNITLRNLSTYNTSGVNGGNFYISSPNNILIENFNGKLSKASENGGNIFINTTNFSISSSWFENSTSLISGGALYLNCLNDSIYDIQNCYFGFTQSSSSGGALYLKFLFSLSTLLIKDCTFFKSSSSYDAGAIFISSTNLNLDISKCCFSDCFINNNNWGTTICIISNNNIHVLKINLITVSSCGLVGRGFATISIEGSKQSLNGLNFTNNKVNQSSAGQFTPYQTSIYQYINILNCSSTNEYIISFFSPVSPPYIDFDYSNIIRNNAKNAGIFYKSMSTQRLIMRFCILMENSGMLYLLQSHFNTYWQTYRSCFINHNGTVHNGFANDNSNVTTLSYTQTHLLSHYSTFLCLTPNELGQADCNLPKDCQTLPPNPTLCNFETNNELQTLSTFSTIFKIFIFTLI